MLHCAQRYKWPRISEFLQWRLAQTHTHTSVKSLDFQCSLRPKQFNFLGYIGHNIFEFWRTAMGWFVYPKLWYKHKNIWNLLLTFLHIIKKDNNINCKCTFGWYELLKKCQNSELIILYDVHTCNLDQLQIFDIFLEEFSSKNNISMANFRRRSQKNPSFSSYKFILFTL